MIALMTLALMSASPAPARYIRAGSDCALGRVVLTDQATSWNKQAEIVINTDDDNNTSLFARCPDLLTSLPGNFRIATKDEVARLDDLTSPNPVIIFHLDVPTISRDGRRAVVSYSYSCNGLCGSGYKARYKLTRGLWRRVGNEKRMWIA